MFRLTGFIALFAGFLSLAAPTHAEEGQIPFDQWMAELRAEALDQGIRPEILDAALAGVTYDAGVVKADRNQPEFKQTFAGYMKARVSDARIRRGQEQIAKHRAALERVGDAYGVQPRFIAAIWGIETNYGSYTGGKDVVQSLVTLAYDPRRSDYFRRELLTALKILNEGHIDPANMKGSWAGAMGQPQFMPTSFWDFAEDFDGDGRRDIWTTPEDVFASIANYLKRYGWEGNRTWGRRVDLPMDFTSKVSDQGLGAPSSRCALRNHVGDLTLDQWQAMGVRRDGGADLPQVNIEASLVQPGGEEGPAFLTYGNFRAILRYNCSNFYALAVGHLADALKFRDQGQEASGAQ